MKIESIKAKNKHQIYARIYIHITYIYVTYRENQRNRMFEVSYV